MAPTPLPRQRIAVLLTLYFAEGFSGTLLLPFVGYMVDDFHITSNVTEVGYYAGFIASAFIFCQFLSSYWWGAVSDRYGRRPVLLIGLAGNALCITLFGFSRSLAWAILSRAANGLLNGNFGVVRVYMREITDQSNQAQAFALIGLTFGCAAVFGPIAGGFLARPALQYPSAFSTHGTFGEYPYLLPCLLSALISFVGLLFGFVVLTESKAPANAAAAPSASSAGAAAAASKAPAPLVPTTTSATAAAKEPLLGSQAASAATSSDSSAPMPVVAAAAAGDSKVASESLTLESHAKPQYAELPVAHDPNRVLQYESGSGDRTYSQVLVSSVNVLADYFDPNLGSTLLSIVSPAERERFAANAAIMNTLSHDMNNSAHAEVATTGASHPTLGSTAGGDMKRVSEDQQLINSDTAASTAAASPMVDPFTSAGSSSGASASASGAAASADENRTRKNYLTLAMNVSFEPTMQRLPPRKLSVSAGGNMTNSGGEGTIWTLFCSKPVALVTACTILLRFVATTVSEVFSLWSITDYAEDGISFSTSDISFCFLAQGATILVFQLFCFKPLTQKFPICGMFQIAMGVHAFHAFIIPFLQPLAQNHAGGFWFLMIVLFIARGAAMAVAYTGGTLLLNNSITDGRAGAVFGLVESFAALGQSIGPLVGSVMLAWSEGNGAPSPFDYHIMFIILSLFAASAIFFARALPPDIERRIESRIRPKA